MCEQGNYAGFKTGQSLTVCIRYEAMRHCPMRDIGLYATPL